MRHFQGEEYENTVDFTIKLKILTIQDCVRTVSNQWQHLYSYINFWAIRW